VRRHGGYRSFHLAEFNNRKTNADSQQQENDYGNN